MLIQIAAVVIIIVFGLPILWFLGGIIFVAILAIFAPIYSLVESFWSFLETGTEKLLVAILTPALKKITQKTENFLAFFCSFKHGLTYSPEPEAVDPQNDNNFNLNIELEKFCCRVFIVEIFLFFLLLFISPRPLLVCCFLPISVLIPVLIYIVRKRK